MKLIAGMILVLVTLSAKAQSNNCNQIQLEKDARLFLDKKSETGDRMITNCLEAQLQEIFSQNIHYKKTGRNLLSEEHAVVEILKLIQHEKEMALIKCESSGKMGCGRLEGAQDIRGLREEIFSQNDLKMLQQDADEKCDINDVNHEDCKVAHEVSGD